MMASKDTINSSTRNYLKEVYSTVKVTKKGQIQRLCGTLSIVIRIAEKFSFLLSLKAILIF